jgi:nicotinamidase/pyrazinamidase
MKRALMIVDLQRDFCPGGSLGIATADKVVPIINSIMDKYEIILASKDWHPYVTVHFDKWPVHCVAETNGAEFHQEIESHRISHVFLKGTYNRDDGYSAFEATNDNLDQYLRKHDIKGLDVCGLATDYCVKATVLDGIKAGFQVRVITDAIDAVNLELGDGDKAITEMMVAGATFILSDDI